MGSSYYEVAIDCIAQDVAERGREAGESARLTKPGSEEHGLCVGRQAAMMEVLAIVSRRRESARRLTEEETNGKGGGS